MKKVVILGLAVTLILFGVAGCGGSSSGSGNIDLDDIDVVTAGPTYPITTGVWVLETRTPQEDGSQRVERVMAKHDPRDEWLHENCGSLLFSTTLPSPFTPSVSLGFGGICPAPKVTVVGENDFKIECTNDRTQRFRKISETPNFQGVMTVLIDGVPEINVDNACAQINFVETPSGDKKEAFYRLNLGSSETGKSGSNIVVFRFNGFPVTGGNEAGPPSSNKDFYFLGSGLLGNVLGPDTILSGNLTITKLDDFFFDATFDFSTALKRQVTGTIQFPH